MANIEELQERIRQLEEELAGSKYIWPMEWELTINEVTILTVLLRHDIASRDSIFFSLYSSRSYIDWPSNNKIVDILISRLNKKLKKFDIRIKSIIRIGWYLPKDIREYYRTLVAPTRA